MLKEIYLDNSATTRPYDEVVSTINTLLKEKYGNPSSLHFKGSEVAQAIAKAREIIATSLNVDCSEIHFTSGGTESNNIAIMGAAYTYQNRGKHLITTVIEHPSVLNTFKHLQEAEFDVDYLDVDSNGYIYLEKLEKLVRPDTVLVSVMQVNNEVGSIQPIEKISKIIRSQNKDIILHVDAIQAYGKMPVLPREIDADLLTISAHKIHGPKGVGTLYIKKGISLKPVLFGGDQENSIRPGTENAPGICGFGKAVEITFKDIEAKWEKMSAIKELLRAKILEFFPESIINTPDKDKSNSSNLTAPHILNVSFKGIRANDFVQFLDSKGICVSTRSACACNKKSYSHVLKAMGIDNERMEGAIRFSFSVFNTDVEIEYTIDCIKKFMNNLK